MRASIRALFAVPLLVALSAVAAQQPPKPAKAPKAPKASKDSADAKEPKDPKDPKEKKVPHPKLYRSEAPLEMTFTINVKQIKKDRNADAPWRSATLTYKDSAGKDVVVPVQAKTRGIWRLKNCEFPPIRIKVSNKSANHTLLEDADEPKLVNVCRNSDTYESYIVQEAQLYRIYRLLTDASHQVRMVKMTYADSATGKVEMTRWAFFIEDPSQVAARLGGGRVKQKGATAEDLEPKQTAIAYAFLYFVANTDVSFNGLHNGEIIAFPDGRNIPIAYDFDFSGVINTSYAGVDPSLPIKSVRERLFRGYCLHKDAYPEVWELFKSKRPAIEALYTDDIGKLLAPNIVKSHLSFFNDFYETIKTPQQAQKRVLADCIK